MFCENIFAKKNAAALDKKATAFVFVIFYLLNSAQNCATLQEKQKVLKRLVRQNTFESKCANSHVAKHSVIHIGKVIY